MNLVKCKLNFNVVEAEPSLGSADEKKVKLNPGDNSKKIMVAGLIFKNEPSRTLFFFIEIVSMVYVVAKITMAVIGF